MPAMPAPVAARPLPWAVLRERAAGGRLLEFLTPTRRTAVDETLAAAARQRTAHADPLEAAAEIASWVSDRVAYVPGATEVQTSAQEAWDKSQGVCHDMAHLTVGLLREVGLPARYVSGYLHPQPEAQPGDEMVGESHARSSTGRRVGDLRSDQPGAGGRAPRARRSRAALRRCPPRSRAYATVPPSSTTDVT